MTAITSTAPIADPRVGITFAKREGRSLTHWLEIQAPVGAEPQGLLDDLAAAGWAVDPMTARGPAYRPLSFDESLPVGDPGRMVFADYEVRDLLLTSPGTGLFAGWSPEEKAAKLAAARKALRSHGFPRVPVWRKTLQDML